MKTGTKNTQSFDLFRGLFGRTTRNQNNRNNNSEMIAMPRSNQSTFTRIRNTFAPALAFAWRLATGTVEVSVQALPGTIAIAAVAATCVAPSTAFAFGEIDTDGDGVADMTVPDEQAEGPAVEGNPCWTQFQACMANNANRAACGNEASSCEDSNPKTSKATKRTRSRWYRKYMNATEALAAKEKELAEARAIGADVNQLKTEVAGMRQDLGKLESQVISAVNAADDAAEEAVEARKAAERAEQAVNKAWQARGGLLLKPLFNVGGGGNSPGFALSIGGWAGGVHKSGAVIGGKLALRGNLAGFYNMDLHNKVVPMVNRLYAEVGLVTGAFIPVGKKGTEVAVLFDPSLLVGSRFKDPNAMVTRGASPGFSGHALIGAHRCLGKRKRFSLGGGGALGGSYAGPAGYADDPYNAMAAAASPSGGFEVGGWFVMGGCQQPKEDKGDEPESTTPPVTTPPTPAPAPAPTPAPQADTTVSGSGSTATDTSSTSSSGSTVIEEEVIEETTTVGGKTTGSKTTTKSTGNGATTTTTTVDK